MSYYGGYFARRPTGGTLSSAAHRKRSRPDSGHDQYRESKISAFRTRRFSMAKFRSRKRTRRGRRRFYRQRSGLPYKLVRTLKTVKHLIWNPGAAGLIASYRLPVNSGNDPFGSGGSGQPLAWDQYGGLYERYAVIKCGVAVEMASVDATNPLCVGINFQTSSTELSTYEHYKELPNTKFQLMTPDMDRIKLYASGSPRRFFGHKKMLADDRLSAAIGSDPTDLLYAHVFAQPIDQATDTGQILGVVTIYQTVVFYKPKTLARS